MWGAVILLVACTQGTEVTLEARQSSSSPTQTCEGQQLGHGSEVIQIGPNTRLVNLIVSSSLLDGVEPNFTLKRSGEHFAFIIKMCQAQDEPCDEYCLYAQGCRSRVSMYPCPYDFGGYRRRSSLWNLAEAGNETGTKLYQITSVGCPSMKLQIWEPNTTVMECFYTQDTGCEWSVVQEKVCQLPFPADVDGTSCNSDPARSLVSSEVYPSLADVYSEPTLCETVAGSSPLDLWKLDGLPTSLSDVSQTVAGANIHSVMLLIVSLLGNMA